MPNYPSAYLTGTLILMLVWVFLFIKKDSRKEMIVISLLSMPFGFAEIFYLRDYWHPQTLLNLNLGLENFIFCFAIGGITTVLYEDISRRGLKKAYKNVNAKALVIPEIFLLVIFVSSIFIFGINSIYATFIVFILAFSMIAFRRHDLIKNSLYTGIIFSLLAIAFYLFFLQLFPGIIENWWKLKNLSGLLILRIPVEEILFAFLYGLVVGSFYKYWKGYRLVKTR